MLERRDFLRSAAVVTTFAVPALPASGDSLNVRGPEAELEALYARFIASHAGAVQAGQRAEALAPDLPDLPPSARCQPGDEALELTVNIWAGGIAVGQPYRSCFALRHAAQLKGFYVPGEHGHAAAVRAEEILAALDSHQRAVRELEEQTGYIAAEQAETAAWEAAAADREALASAQATSLRGMLLKAKAIVTTEHDAAGLDDWHEETLEHQGDSSTALAVSMALDLIKMAGLA